MNTYKINVRLVHSWESQEEYEWEGEAENIDEANDLAKTDAKNNYDGNLDQADHEDCYVVSTQLIDAIAGEGEKLDATPRCKFTKDMFG